LRHAGGYIFIVTTDQNGWIELSTDGEHLWVVVERR